MNNFMEELDFARLSVDGGGAFGCSLSSYS